MVHIKYRFDKNCYIYGSHSLSSDIYILWWNTAIIINQTTMDYNCIEAECYQGQNSYINDAKRIYGKVMLLLTYWKSLNVYTHISYQC